MEQDEDKHGPLIASAINEICGFHLKRRGLIPPSKLVGTLVFLVLSADYAPGIAPNLLAASHQSRR